MLTLDSLFSYLDEQIAEDTLQGRAVDLKQLIKATEFLAETAAQAGDSASAERFRRVTAIAKDALDRTRR